MTPDAPQWIETCFRLYLRDFEHMAYECGVLKPNRFKTQRIRLKYFIDQLRMRRSQ